MDDSTFDFPLDPALAHDVDANDRDAEEAALEAIRVAINNNNNNHAVEGIITHGGSPPANGMAHGAHGITENQTPRTDPSTLSERIERAVQVLQSVINQHAGTFVGLEATDMLGGIVKDLTQALDEIKEREASASNVTGSASASLDPALALSFVSRAEYDTLKQQHDVLLASASTYPVPKRQSPVPLHRAPLAAPTPLAHIPPTAVAGPSRNRKARTSRPSSAVAEDGQTGEPLTELKAGERGDENAAVGPTGRKRRSMKLEHLVHQMANRRLGLEYPVSGFRVAGFTTLPDPATPAPPINMSLNGVQEYRPDFTKPVDDVDIKAFVGIVVEDAWAAWTEGVGEGEVGVDIVKVQEAVETYWTRLQKRWQEQEARTRGEVHKDELARKKQNQYRRQQSLVARRTAAFDSSPLNACRLRALYRTLLTMDFAPATNERPDPARTYSEDQWAAYRRQQLGGRAISGHEVVDIFWLSPAARSLLILLDTCTSARSTTSNRRKGRPKAPSPTFHLPSSLWDNSPARLPLLRPKDPSGLPVPDTPGIILFTFHVHPDIIAQYPDWARGLYDDPPPNAADMGLGSLAEVLSGDMYELLRARVKKDKERAGPVDELSDEEVQDILTRPEVIGGDEEDGDAEGDLILNTPVLRPTTSTSNTTPTSLAQVQGQVQGSGPDSSTIDYSGINLLTGLDGDMLTDGLGEGLESYVALSHAAQVEAQAEAEARMALQVVNAANTSAGGADDALVADEGVVADTEIGGEDADRGKGKGRIGTSMRARKIGKKLGHGPPEGAAMPVAKRQRVGVGTMSGRVGGDRIGVGVGVGSASRREDLRAADDEVGREIQGDAGYLEML